jgi:hypothetical protein
MESSNGGTALVETLCAFLFIIVLVSATLKSTHSASTAYLRLNREAALQKRADLAASFFTGPAIRGLEYRGIPLVVPHYFNEQTKRALVSRPLAPHFRPKPGCHSLSLAVLSSSAEIRVLRSRKTSTKTLELTGCQHGVRLEFAKFYLGLGIDGYVPLQGILRRVVQQGTSCLDGLLLGGSLSLIEHTPFDKTPEQLSVVDILQTISVMIPLEDAFTVYVAANNTLRRFSHLNIENQPINYAAHCLRLTREESSLGTPILHYELSLLADTDTIYKRNGVLPLSAPLTGHLDYVL